jgi:ABC-type lipoprotein export system ATPase subunit
VPALALKPILRATGLHKSFQMGDSIVQVLKDVDLSIAPGEFVAIEGRSGSGKSTLLHILGALDSVDAGTVTFRDRSYARAAKGERHPLIEIVLGRWLKYAVWAGFGSVVCMVLAALFAPPGQWVWLTIPVGVVVAMLLTRWITWVTLSLLSLPEDRLAANLRSREFGFVFQFYHLLPELNVVENTLLSPMISNSWLSFFGQRRRLREKAVEILTELGMAHRLTHRPNQLSGGERQRVAIARALMNEPKVLFADEPTGNLDADTGRQIMGVLERLHREKGQTIVMVTHDRSLARKTDRVLVLKHGKLEPAEG